MQYDRLTNPVEWLVIDRPTLKGSNHGSNKECFESVESAYMRTKQKLDAERLRRIWRQCNEKERDS